MSLNPLIVVGVVIAFVLFVMTNRSVQKGRTAASLITATATIPVGIIITLTLEQSAQMVFAGVFLGCIGAAAALLLAFFGDDIEFDERAWSHLSKVHVAAFVGYIVVGLASLGLSYLLPTPQF